MPIQVNTRDTIELAVFDVVNDDLSHPDQGVCSVYVDFIHNVVGDFEMWLVAPSGRQVKLIGPNASSPVAGLGFEYIVTFLAERLNVAPSNQKWDNDLPNPIAAGVTEGDFFPYSGRLDDLDMGPVNGTWLLVMETQTTTIALPGVLRDVKITFCDPLGENCCLAEAGQFAVDSTVQVCAGTPLPGIRPAIDFGVSQPDTTEYAYTWLLTSDSLLIDRDTLADWGTLPPGTYTMYGLSYARTDTSRLPVVDGTLRIDTLRSQLARPDPPFCGDLTENAWSIEVLPLSDTTFIQEFLCEGDTLSFADTTFSDSGSYTFDLQNQNGCDSIVVLALDVTPIADQVIDSTICVGESVVIGTSVYTATGTYVDTLLSPAGCQSITTLNLSVIVPSRDTVRQVVCSGQNITVGGQTFDTTGVYEVALTNVAGCDSIVVLDLTVLAPQAVVTPGERTLTCSRPRVLLDGTNSGPTGDSSLRYRWERQREGTFSVDVVGTDSQLTVDRGGSYFLQVQIQKDSVICSNRSLEVFVSVDTVPPPVEAGSDQSITCNQPTVILGSPLLMNDALTEISWRSSAAVFPGDTAAARPVVDQSGLYFVTITNLQNGCTAMDSVRVRADTTRPAFTLASNGPLSCSQDIVTVGPDSGSDEGNLFSYAWAGPCLLFSGDTSRVDVNCAGTYQLEMTNLVNGCSTVRSIEVVEDSNSPVATVASDTVALDCFSGEAVLDASPSQGGTISWWQNDTLIGAGAQLMVTNAGDYQLIVTNATFDCADTLGVSVILDCTPTAVIQPPSSLTCTSGRVLLDATSSADGNPLSYQWEGPNAGCLSASAGTQVEVGCAGIYQLIVTNAAVGQSDTAEVEVIDRTTLPTVVVSPDQVLTCSNPEALLSAVGSTAGPAIQYTWINDLGDTLGMDPTVEVMEAGSYLLSVLNTETGCRDEDIVQVNRDADLPDIRFGSSFLPCNQDTFRFEALAVPPSIDYVYQWSGTNIIGNTDSSFVLVNTPGTYRLEVIDTLTGCRVVESAVVEEQVCGPCLEPLVADTLTCDQPAILLTVTLCSDCTNCAYRWSTADGQILTDPTQPFIEVDAAGSYRVVVTDAQGNAGEETVRVVADKRFPDIPPQTDVVLTCAQPMLTLGQNLPAPGDSIRYRWYNEFDTLVNTPNAPLLTIDRGGLYWLEAMHPTTGCSLRDTVRVTTAQTIPSIDAGSNDTLDCANPVFRLPGQIASDERNIRYQWTTTDGNIRGGAGSLNPLIEGPGWYVFTAQDTLTGCLAVDSVRLIPPQDFPELAPITPIFLGCSQNEVGVEAPIAAASNLRYEWRDVTGDVLADQREAFFSRPGQYEVWVENIDNGCSDAITFSVAPDTATPQPMLPGQTVLGCTDLSVELSTGLPPTAPYTYTWTSAGGLDLSAMDEPVLSVARPDSFFLTVRDTTNNCVATDTSVVTVTEARPSITLPALYALTCDEPAQQLAAAVNGEADDYSFQWSTPDGQIATDTDRLMISVSMPGVYQLLATDLVTGCQAEVATTVIRDQGAPRPIIDTVGALPLDCRSTSVVLDAGRSQTTSAMTPRFTWQVVTGSTPAGDLSGTQLTILDPVSLQLTVVDPANGCKDSTLIVVAADWEVPPVPVLSSPDTLTCERGATLIEVINYDEDLSAFWLESGDTLATDIGTLEVATPGVYQFVVVDQDNGCRAESQATVAQIISRPELAVSDDGTLGCGGDGTVRLRVEDARSGTLSDISWTGPDGGVPGMPSSREILVTLPGVYTVTAGYSESGCRDTVSYTVAINASAIDSAVILADLVGCGAEATGTIEVRNVVGGQGPFLYAFGANSPLMTTPKVTNLSPGVYEVRIEDANGCTWTESVRIASGNNLAMDLGPDQEIVSGDSLELIPTLTGAFDQLIWRVQDQVVGTADRLSVAPSFTVSYRLTGTGTDGCVVTDAVTVFVREELPVYLPTVFAPNSEQEANRVFFIQAGEQVVEVEQFEVFNRWGEQVFARTAFAPNDPQYGWDGQFRGRALNTGVYVYQIIVRLRNGDRRMVKGDITLLR